MKRILVTLALTGMAVLLTLPSRALARMSAATAPCAVLPAADSVSPDSLRAALSQQRAAFERQRPAFDSLRAALSQQRRQTSQRMGPVAADSAAELPCQPGDTLTCIYYGERVVPRLPNPCKGRTLRKLARVVYPGTWTQPTADGLRYPVAIMHIPDDTSDALYARFLKLEARTPGLTVVRDFRAGPAEVAQQ